MIRIKIRRQFFVMGTGSNIIPEKTLSPRNQFGYFFGKTCRRYKS